MVGSQPPWGEGAREGWEQQPPDRREGGLLLAPLMGGAEGEYSNCWILHQKFDNFAVVFGCKMLDSTLLAFSRCARGSYLNL